MITRVPPLVIPQARIMKRPGLILPNRAMWNGTRDLSVTQNVLRFLGSDDAGAGGANASKYCAIDFINPHTNGLPIWGPSNAGITVIVERLTRQQTGYFGAAPWWGNKGVFLWDGGASNSYWGTCPYPQNSDVSGTTHWYEISGMDRGADNLFNLAGAHVVVTHNVMRVQGIRITYDSGTGRKILTHYLDLPSVANADVMQGPVVGNEDNSIGFGNIDPTNPCLSFGDSHWTDFAKERFSGDLGRWKIFAADIGQAKMLTEAADMSAIKTSEGAAAIWMGKNNWRDVDDLSCDFGTGRSMVWADSTFKASCVALGS